MMTQHEAWLKLTKEDPIDPDLPICDPHHHLWDHPDDLPEDRVPDSHRQVRHYLLKELLEDTGGGHNIEQTVFMECRSMYKKGWPTGTAPYRRDRVCAGYCRPECEWTIWEYCCRCRNCGFCRSHLGQCSSTCSWRHT